MLISKLRKHFQNRKKGSLLIEFLVVMPVLFFIGWSIMQMMFFSSSQTAVQHAAIDASRTLTIELRGHEGPLPEEGTQEGDQLQARMIDQVSQRLQNNGVTMMFHELGEPASPVISWENRNECQNLLANDEPRLICAYTNENEINGRIIEEIEVIVSSEFWVIGNFIPGLQGTLYANGMGTSNKEIADRFQYWEGAD